jgi:hypothetical protein
VLLIQEHLFQGREKRQRSHPRTANFGTPVQVEIGKPREGRQSFHALVADTGAAQI